MTLLFLFSSYKFVKIKNHQVIIFICYLFCQFSCSSLKVILFFVIVYLCIITKNLLYLNVFNKKRKERKKKEKIIIIIFWNFRKKKLIMIKKIYKAKKENKS